MPKRRKSIKMIDGNRDTCQAEAYIQWSIHKGMHVSWERWESWHHKKVQVIIWRDQFSSFCISIYDDCMTELDAVNFRYQDYGFVALGFCAQPCAIDDRIFRDQRTSNNL